MRPRTQALKLCWRDRLTDAYIEATWIGARGVPTLSDPRDRNLAFLAYRAALDREEKAALAYELIAEQIARRAHQ